VEQFSVELSQEAEKDIESIAGYIAQDNPRWAIEYALELRIKIDASLSIFPDKYIKRKKHYVMTHWNYLVFFNIHRDSMQVVVLGIYNSAQYQKYARMLFE